MIKFSQIAPFSSGLAAIKQKGKWGFINKLGDLIIPCEYDLINLPINSGRIAVKKNGKWGYIDTNNIPIIDFLFDKALAFEDGCGIVKIGSFWGVVDMQGNMIIQPSYDEITYSLNHMFLARKGDKWGFINILGDIVLPFIYDKATRFSYNLSYVCIGQKHGFINLQGNFILELTSKQRIYIKPNFTFEALIILNTTGFNKYDWSIYSNKGDLIVDSLKYTRINSFYEGFASVMYYDNRAKWGVINMQGELTIPCEYDDISPFLYGLAFAKKGIYAGYIDKTNNIKIPFKYKVASTFSENLAYVSHNRWDAHIINTDGDIILNIKKEKTFENILNFCAYRWTDLFG